jgi:hypothetical protein
MRQFLFLLAILAGVSSLSAQSRKQIKELKIKSMTETTVVYRDGKETASYKSEYKTFDKEGNTLTDTEYNQDGSVKRKETNKYAGKDKIDEVVENYNTGSDDNDGPKKYHHTTWKYNSNGDKIEECEYDAAGTLLKKTTIAYNNNGDRMFEMTYDGAGRMTKKIAYGYDNKGLRTEKKIFGPGDVLVKDIKYTYTY